METRQTAKITWANGVSADYPVRFAGDTTLILEEGPQLTVIVRRNLAEDKPTWRFDGNPVEVQVEETN